MKRGLSGVKTLCVVKMGTSRVVLDLVRFGVVVKLPIVHIRLLVREAKALPRDAYFFRKWLLVSMDSDGFCGVQRLLLKGVADNWREFWFCLWGGHDFVQPTYFSLFGLVNIQKRGDPLSIERALFTKQMKKLVGEEYFFKDPHHFRSPDNFCLRNGRLVMTDYGSRATREIISQRGACVYNNFVVELGQ